MSSSGWKGFLTASEGATSRVLIEELFKYSITSDDAILAEMMLQNGANPNQQISTRDSGNCRSALEFAVRHQLNGVINLLLKSGALCSQMALKDAIVAENFDTADQMLQSDPSLDVNFNFLDDRDLITTLEPGHLELETLTLVGLVCLHTDGSTYCDCDEIFDWHMRTHVDGCRMNNAIAAMEYLLGHGAEITLDTMILASFSVDIDTLQFLWEHGGNLTGFSPLGFSCLAAASLRAELQYDVFDILMCLGAAIDIPQSHSAFGSQESPFHWPCLHKPANHERDRSQVPKILDLLIESGGNINYCIRHVCAPSRLDEARDRFLWSQSSKFTTSWAQIEQAKAESPLEYAIIAGNEGTALELIGRGCQLTGREVKLAVKFGMLSLLQALLGNHSSRRSGGEYIERTCFRLALRWGHDKIVRFLLREGATFGEQDMIDALQYPGTSILSTKTQINLIHSTTDLERRQIFRLPLLELCCLKFSGITVNEILRRFPATYDSGALCAIVLRVLKGHDAFRIADVQNMISRRTESNRNWEEENTALLVAAMFNHVDILRSLIAPQTTSVMKNARLSQNDLYWILSHRSPGTLDFEMDPTRNLGCKNWISCSPLIGIATAPFEWDVSMSILDHLLACSYEPDAFTVVVAAAKSNTWLLLRLQSFENWRSIVSIDNGDRHPWCPTALQIAASHGNRILVQLLLDSGVSVNEPPANQPVGNVLPRTALQAVVEKGIMKLVNLFIEHGACINAPAAENSGATALQLACIHGHLEISIRLLELGADVNARGAQKNGRTALEGAAEHGRIDTIQLLLNHGVCTDGFYRVQYIKAVGYAEKNLHYAAAELLKKHREWSAEDQELYERLQTDERCDV